MPCSPHATLSTWPGTLGGPVGLAGGRVQRQHRGVRGRRRRFSLAELGQADLPAVIGIEKRVRALEPFAFTGGLVHDDQHVAEYPGQDTAGAVGTPAFGAVRRTAAHPLLLMEPVGQPETFAVVTQALQHRDLACFPFMTSAGQQDQAFMNHRVGRPAAHRGDGLVLAGHPRGHEPSPAAAATPDSIRATLLRRPTFTRCSVASDA
jgi:hypothetical protein